MEIGEFFNCFKLKVEIDYACILDYNYDIINFSGSERFKIRINYEC